MVLGQKKQTQVGDRMVTRQRREGSKMVSRTGEGSVSDVKTAISLSPPVQASPGTAGDRWPCLPKVES